MDDRLALNHCIPIATSLYASHKIAVYNLKYI
jgi:hypothetical protein